MCQIVEDIHSLIDSPSHFLKAHLYKFLCLAQVAGGPGGGPFTQLTHEELITLVVRQQTDLSKKDCKINELEDYIDNLLVRVIEEKPAILRAVNTTKPV